jgi:hypothetical protein
VPYCGAASCWLVVRWKCWCCCGFGSGSGSYPSMNWSQVFSLLIPQVLYRMLKLDIKWTLGTVRVCDIFNHLFHVEHEHRNRRRIGVRLWLPHLLCSTVVCDNGLWSSWLSKEYKWKMEFWNNIICPKITLFHRNVALIP